MEVAEPFYLQLVFNYAARLIQLIVGVNKNLKTGIN
jgi:hypothetical protein